MNLLNPLGRKGDILTQLIGMVLLLMLLAALLPAIIAIIQGVIISVGVCGAVWIFITVVKKTMPKKRVRHNGVVDPNDGRLRRIRRRKAKSNRHPQG